MHPVTAKHAVTDAVWKARFMNCSVISVGLRSLRVQAYPGVGTVQSARLRQSFSLVVPHIRTYDLPYPIRYLYKLAKRTAVMSMSTNAEALSQI